MTPTGLLAFWAWYVASFAGKAPCTAACVAYDYGRLAASAADYFDGDRSEGGER